MPGAEDAESPDSGLRVPDDARDLEQDRLAYYAELAARARSRPPRTHRLWHPAHRQRLLLVAVILAGSLVASLIVVFAPRPEVVPGPLPLASPTGSSAGDVGRPGGLLPDAEVLVSGSTRPLRALRPAVLVLPPPGGCVDEPCRQAVLTATTAAREYRFATAVVVPPTDERAAREAARSWAAGIPVIVDPSEALAGATDPLGVTVVTVHADGVVGSVLRDLRPGQALALTLSRLSQPGAR